VYEHTNTAHTYKHSCTHTYTHAPFQIGMIMSALKRQVAHYDPAYKTAHVLLR